ncbi:O-methyltransferase [Salirhabdus salicampi]|uniref:O-methyltransferase n=1 Tax=Salirhabdus salicampi TaxID=476102 RepID=UPI0020C3CDD3|nr:O-methyltransferase [Salirhabdus salicampi]MCP8616956.1 O-methyltransferase [Salirhabdus salicampi]
MEDSLKAYLLSTMKEKSKLIQTMEQYAEEHNVPIMDSFGIELLQQIIRIQRPKRILEIGTAIGYSAIRMLDAFPQATIVTAERDMTRISVAHSFINEANYEDHIHVVEGDALEQADQLLAKGPYDLVFIDAAKGQYQQFFDIFSKAVSTGGTVITDNVIFKGYVVEKDDDNDRFQKIGSKVRQFNDWLIEQKEFDTTIVPVGDGVAISVKR